MDRYGVARWIPRRHRRERQEGPIDDPVVSEKIATTQGIIEGQHFDLRKTLWSYSTVVDGQRRAWHDARDEVLTGRAGTQLEQSESASYEGKLAAFGPEVLAAVERQITLFHMDRLWADHLGRIADVREGISLVRLDGQDPLQQFYRQLADLYADIAGQLEEAVRETFEAATITGEGIDLQREGIEGPTATWTYRVDEDPFSFLGSIADLSNIGYGITTGLYFGPFFLVRALYRRLAGKGRG